MTFTLPYYVRPRLEMTAQNLCWPDILSRVKFGVILSPDIYIIKNKKNLTAIYKNKYIYKFIFIYIKYIL